MSGMGSRKNQFLSVETSLSIALRKTVHVIRAGNERFLISTDVDRTSFLTKLEDDEQKTQSSSTETLENLNKLINPLTFQHIQDLKTNTIKTPPPQQSVMRNILEKINSI